MNIQVEKHVIDEAVLDLIGKAFRFDHAKGIAEWIKNSIDAYNLANSPDEEQVVIINLEIADNKHIRTIEVIDFVGMTKSKIDQAFKRWFDPKAAQLSDEALKKEVKTLGGHGNGGKFYMREMFKTSQIITYKNGKLNVFGFNQNKQYGFVSEFTNRDISIEEACSIAGLNKNSNLFNQFKPVLFRKNAFSIVKGESPKPIYKTNYLNSLVDNLIVHPQARRIIQRKNIYLVINNLIPQKLVIPQLPPKEGYEKPFEFVCPNEMVFANERIRMYNTEADKIKLVLFTSHEPLKGTKYRGLNSIDFLGDVGVIANYDISELGFFSSFIYSEFLYGECYAQVMESEDYVTNDREKFEESDKTKALLNWIQQCVSEVCNKMEDSAKKDKVRINLKQTSLFNELLNKWKNRFLQKLIRESLAGVGNFGVEGQDSIDWTGKSEDKKTDRDSKAKTVGDKGGSKTKKNSAFPKVLISGEDFDPFSQDGQTLLCDPRQPAVYQRPIDYKNGIYWINTSKVFAQTILNKNGAESIRWREYLFQRYVDIIIKEAISTLGKKDVVLTADTVNNEIEKRISDIMDTAIEDLNQFLFESDYNL